MLVKQLPPMSQLWDSVTQTLIKSQYGTVTGVKSGKIAQISINWKSASTDSWGSGQFGTIPEVGGLRSSRMARGRGVMVAASVISFWKRMAISVMPIVARGRTAARSPGR